MSYELIKLINLKIISSYLVLKIPYNIPCFKAIRKQNIAASFKKSVFYFSFSTEG